MPGASQRTAFIAALAISAGAAIAAVPAVATEPALLPARSSALLVRLSALPVGPGLGGAVIDMSAAPDGTAHILTSSRQGRTETIIERRFGPSGEIGPRVVMSRGSFSADAAILPGGGALVTRQPPGESEKRLEIVDVSPSGVPLATQQLETAGLWLGNSGPKVGPTGAAVIEFQERRRGRIVQSVGFRPAGATTFGARLRLGSTKAPTSDQLPDDIGDGIVDTELRFAVSPDGSAAVLALPDTKRVGPAYVRRISATGVLGPRIDLGIGARRRVAGQLKFGPSGQLVVGIVATDTALGRGKVLATVLPAGATAAPAPQRLMTADRNTSADDLLSIDTGPGDRVIILASSGDGDRSRTRLFESIGGGAFAQTAMLPTVFPYGLRVFARADGGATAIWTAQAQDDFDDAGVYLASRPAGGAFSAPRRVTPTETDGDFIELDEALPLAGGAFAVSYIKFLGSDGPGYLVIAQP